MYRRFPFGLSSLTPCELGKQSLIDVINTTGKKLKVGAFIVSERFAHYYDVTSLCIDGTEQLSATVIPASIFMRSTGYVPLACDDIAPRAHVQLVVVNRCAPPEAAYFQAVLTCEWEGEEETRAKEETTATLALAPATNGSVSPPVVPPQAPGAAELPRIPGSTA